MGLVKTPIVDKNGRRTTVLKSSGTPTGASTTLASVKPKLSPAPKRAKPHQMDRVFTMNVDSSFQNSHLGAVLNSMYPDKRLESGSIINGEVRVTSREIYAVARHGLDIREAATVAHFGINDLDGVKAVVERSGNVFDRPPTPWVDVLDENDIDIFALHESMANGLNYGSLGSCNPEVVADLVRVYGYKSLANTGVPELIREGKIDWRDVQEIGVTRSAKNIWVVKEYLDRKSERSPAAISYPYMPTDRVKAAIIETEKRPRDSSFTWQTREQADGQVVAYSRAYEYLGDDIDNFHMPELVLALSKEGLMPEDDCLPLVSFCDDLIHRVRSDRDLSMEIMANLGGDKTYGAVVDEYATGTGAVEPAWKLADLADFHERGLSVAESIDALRTGMSPAEAEGVYRANVAAPIADGWL